MRIELLQKLTTVAIVLALGVIMLGAYTRLTDAGLGCPDWPGCYGQLVLPASKLERANAQHLFPAIPIEAAKAWTEMVHRYLAGTLGFLIFLIAFVSMGRFKLPLLFLCLLIFQAALGMWTVTLKLLPQVVMGHLKQRRSKK